MSYLIEILLPARREHRNQANFELVRDELTRRFGGLTLHTNAPAEGLWKDDDDVELDRIVVAEVMSDELDRSWWAAYREKLEARFDQDEIVVRVTEIERL
jgi:hypothetical protein